VQVVMASSEKRLDLVEAKARLLGVSADELIELAVEAYELPAEQEAMELRSLIEAINETIPKTLRLIDECRDKIQEALGQSGHQAISTDDDPGNSTVSQRKRNLSGGEQTDRHVGARLRDRRAKLGLTQQQLAEMIGVTREREQKYERGNTRISARRLADLSRILNVSVSYFFDDIEESGSISTNAASEPSHLRDRVSRLEGMLAGGALGSGSPRRLPRPRRQD
jgi:transcriptional regulator with XRE-family HTH domain